MNCAVVKQVEGKSSPSQVIAIKGSTVWLHWNYTYIGDGAHRGTVSVTTNYIEQIIGFNSISHPSIQLLAQRLGQNGALKLLSSIPAPFNGRVAMISSNSTLVIRGLQYNDSLYQFSSNVKVTQDTGGGPVLYIYKLKPIVTMTVKGMR